VRLVNRARLRRIVIALVLCLALAGSATAAKAPPFKLGRYTGTTAQGDPGSGRKFVITFTIEKRRISNVRATTRDRCSDGSFFEVDQAGFTSARLDSKGRFTLRAGPRQQPAVMKGRVRGSKASGTITDRSNDAVSSGVCEASTRWTAKLSR
jgi:hypothetical protein